MRSPAPIPLFDFLSLNLGKPLINSHFTGKHRMRDQRGMTLAEVIVGVLIMALVATVSLAMVTTSYQMSAKTRLSDNARAVLRTYGDQFLKLEPADILDATTTLVEPQQFKDLRYDPLRHEETEEFIIATLTEPIGTNGGGVVNATITRSVAFVDIATGADHTGGVQNQAGYLLRATFTATYPFAGKTQSVSFTLLRSCVTQ